MSERHAQLGGVLPAPIRGAAEPIEARRFSHPALGARVIVRLSQAGLREADELAMSVLGCAPAGDPVVVGASVRRAVGFPAAAILRDPDNARHALDVMRDLERATRRAKSKPGHAKDAIDAIAKQLARSVPHFLPSFYEEAARRFVAAGAKTQAATFFGKAREAERVYALEVDPEARRDAFLELALSGALTSAALSDYAKDLEGADDTESAHRELRALAVRATVGGMPPWGTMLRDLRRLAKRAGHDAHEAEASVLLEVLESPALAHASMAFWEDARSTLVRVARGDAAVRARLRGLFPSAHKNGSAAWWITLLDDAGAIDDLATLEEPIAPWVSRIAAHLQRGWRGIDAPDALFALLRRFAERLRRDAVPLTLAKGHWIDPDLVDLAIELELPLVEPHANQRVPLHAWSDAFGRATTRETKERPRALSALTNDPRFAPKVALAVEETMGRETFEDLADQRPALGAVRDRIVRERVQTLREGGLPALESVKVWLEGKTRAETFRALPAELDALRTLDVAELLGVTLRGGIVDELGWIALDEAIAQLARDDGAMPTLAGAFPHPIVVGARRTIVLGATGRIAEIEIEPPGKVEAAYWSGGQVLYLCADRKVSWKRSYLWSGARTVHELAYWYRGPDFVIELEDGLTTLGGRALAPGDAPRVDMRALCSDGRTVWSLQHRGAAGSQWVEQSPRTGELGRRSLPSFFESFSDGDARIDEVRSALVPARGLTTSPLGVRDGLVGMRVRSRGEIVESERIDGVRWVGPHAARAIVTWPGDDAPRVIVDAATHAHHHGDPMYVLLDAKGREASLLGANSTHAVSYQRGTERPMPPWWLHFAATRDERGSRALRAMTTERAAALLAAAGDVDDLEQARVAVASALPEVTSPVLQRAIAGVVRRARWLAKGLAEKVALRDPARATRTVVGTIAIGELRPLLALVGQGAGWSHDQAITAEIDAVGRVARAHLAGERVPDEVGKGGDLAWECALEAPDAVVLQTAFPAWSDTSRRTAHTFAEALAAAGLLSLPNARVLRGTLEVSKLPKPVTLACATFSSGESLYLVRKVWQSAVVLEVSRSGTFVAPAWLNVEREARVWSGTAETVPALARTIEQRGALAFGREHAAIVMERAGSTSTEAAVWLGGLPAATPPNEFFSKELRERFGVKAKETEKIAVALGARERPAFRAMLSQLASEPLGDDLVALATRIGELLRARVGETVQVDEALADELAKDLNKLVPEPPSTTMRWMLEGEKGSRLSRQPKLAIHPRPQDASFDVATVRLVALYLAHLAVELPAGHPFLATLASVYRIARERLDDPELLLPLGMHHVPWEQGKSPIEATNEALAKLGGIAFERDGARGRDLGAYVAAAPSAGWMLQYFFRPARMSEDPKALAALAGPVSALDWAGFLRSDPCAAIVARIGDPTRTAGSYDACPALDVVDDVAATHGLSRDAAILYAQTLALPAPSDAKVRRWNGWSAKTLESARDELAGKELVEIAKRERTGRSHFLPGPWEALRAPAKPLESFKLPFLARKGANGWTFPLGVQVPLEPMPAHFRTVWARAKVEPPRLEEIAR
ncbi:hypothetical protein [Sandaracinus amylolyticus]|uniref:hypothetical protein n=1 Tax=Sandaracinus amylolyticus TaxID=927083 RepID=UPI001F219E19|nr:hypothetical protein [Sandaracinus amylolyticus]UJR85122.1 Hypothetical protein I5071_72020 [Sandaracinus amylolyticus]